VLRCSNIFPEVFPRASQHKLTYIKRVASDTHLKSLEHWGRGFETRKVSIFDHTSFLSSSFKIIPSVCPECMKQLGNRKTDNECWYWRTFRNFVEPFQF
jgi:hypothetical protein